MPTWLNIVKYQFDSFSLIFCFLYKNHILCYRHFIVMSFNTRSMIVIVNNFHNSPISNQSGSTFHFVVRSTPPESFFWQLLLTMERILVEYKFRIFLGRDYVNDTIWKKIFVIQNNLLQCRLPTFCHFGDVDEVVK